LAGIVAADMSRAIETPAPFAQDKLELKVY
jgi:hypothetical protein